MKLFLFILLFPFIVNASCPQLYGKQNQGGDWSFSIKQEGGMLPVESDSNCLGQAGALKLSGNLLTGKKYILDKKLLAEKLAKEKADKEKYDAENAKVSPAYIKMLEDRLKDLEAKK